MTGTTVLMDERFMDNVDELEHPLDCLKGARVVAYASQSALEARRRYGVTAQSIAESAPLAVETDGLGHMRVNYEGLISLLVGAVVELDAKVKALESAKPAPAKPRAYIKKGAGSKGE